MRANNSYCVLTFRFANLGSLPSATAFDTTVRFALVLDLRRTLLKKKNRPVVLVAEVQQGAHYLLEAKVAVTCDTFEGAGRYVETVRVS